MFERIEDLLTVMLSVIAALTTLVGVLEQLLKLWQAVQAEDSEVAQQLEKDILRLQADLETQARQIEVLRTQEKKWMSALNSFDKHNTLNSQTSTGSSGRMTSS